MSEPTEKELPHGVYESPFDEYPGTISLPWPLMYSPHFQEYWELAIAPAKGLVLLDWDAHYLPWKGAKHLISQYGEWAITGIDKGDFEADRLPLSVQQWVLNCTKKYLEPELGPKARPVALTLI